MDDIRTRYARLFGRGEGTERIEAFSDAVFAIALTLLVLDLRLPADLDDLWAGLVALWPQYFAFLLSFVIIAINWINHHRKFRVIERYDSGLLRINLVFLLFVAIVPFPTSVLSDYGQQTPAVVLYAVVVSGLSLLQLWMWRHAWTHGLMSADVDAGVIRYVTFGILAAPVVFAASIPVAFFAPDWAIYSWFLIVPVSFVFDRISRSSDSASAAAR